MLRFYYVDPSYIAHLKAVEPKIPNTQYSGHEKFFCGIVLEIYDYAYYAPISHYKKKLKTNILITDKGTPISSIRFSFMFPVPRTALTKMDFTEIAKTDPHYADLLQKEYSFCNRHQEAIYRKAREVYRISLDKTHPLSDKCCDFQKLEGVSPLWQPEKAEE